MFAFRFSEPLVLLGLWGVLVLAGLAVWGIRCGLRARVAFTRRAEELAPVSRVRRYLQAGLLLAALGLVVVALARPSWSSRSVTVQQRGRDVAFVVDVSRSMQAQDMVPNRLERAKLAILDAIPQLEGDRVAVLAFAGSAQVVAPLTRDYHFVEWAVESLSPVSVPEGGSLVGDALRVATEDVFDPLVKRRKDVIVLSDGEDQGSYPVDAAAAAGRNGVRLVTIGLGATGRGTKIPIGGDREGYLEVDGREVYSRLEAETLREMAQATPGGRYLDVGTGAFDLGEIYRNLILSEEDFAMGEVDIVQYEEQFQLFLLAAVLLVGAATLVGDGRMRTGNAKGRARTGGENGTQRGAGIGTGSASAVLLLAMLALFPADSWARGAAENVSAGNRAYEENALSDALGYYEEAREVAPEESVPLYNLGVVLYRQENYPAALKAFQDMRTDTTELAALSHYNQGNTLARLGRTVERSEPAQALALYRRSIGAYKRVIALEEEDEKARRNIEVVRQWMEPLLQQQASSESQSQQEGQQSSERQQQQGSGEQSQSEDGSDDSGEPNESTPEQPEQQPEDGGEQDMSRNESPAETAQEILDEEEQRRREQAESAARRQSGESPTW